MAKRLTDREFNELVNNITQQVVTTLRSEGTAPPLAQGGADCNHQANGSCVQHCSDQVRQVVATGASRISSNLGSIPNDLSVARFIDHTLLKPDASADEVAQLCREAREYHFASVCVNSTYVPLCSDLLKGSDVAVCVVVGFPLGASLPEVKAYEAQMAIQNGATEVDMVLNVGALKSRDLKLLHRDIATVVATCHANSVICKVILETSKLTNEEKVIASQIAKMAGADFVKTSTGFGGGGATIDDVELMKRVVGPDIGVKASGGVRTYSDAQAMVKAGATRIGASAGVMIVRQEQGEDVKSGKGY